MRICRNILWIEIIKVNKRNQAWKELISWMRDSNCLLSDNSNIGGTQSNIKWTYLSSFIFFPHCKRNFSSHTDFNMWINVSQAGYYRNKYKQQFRKYLLNTSNEDKSLTKTVKKHFSQLATYNSIKYFLPGQTLRFPFKPR